VVVDLALQRADVHGVALELGAQVLDLGQTGGVHSERLRLLDDLGQFLLDLGLVGGLVERERRCTCGSRSLSRNCVTSALLACMMR
jgi:hypothetical protein